MIRSRLFFGSHPQPCSATDTIILTRSGICRRTDHLTRKSKFLLLQDTKLPLSLSRRPHAELPGPLEVPQFKTGLSLVCASYLDHGVQRCLGRFDFAILHHASCHKTEPTEELMGPGTGGNSRGVCNGSGRGFTLLRRHPAKSQCAPHAPSLLKGSQAPLGHIHTSG